MVTVQSITKVDGPQRVYNLEVASLDGQITHNYFVGEDEIWTHNVIQKIRNALGRNGRIVARVVIGLATGELGPDCKKDVPISNQRNVGDPPPDPSKWPFSDTGGTVSPGGVFGNFSRF